MYKKVFFFEYFILFWWLLKLNRIKVVISCEYMINLCSIVKFYSFIRWFYRIFDYENNSKFWAEVYIEVWIEVFLMTVLLTLLLCDIAFIVFTRSIW